MRPMLLAALLLLAAAPSRAATFLALDAPWTPFCFGAAGTEATGCVGGGGGSSPFFTIAGGTTTTIEVTDAFLSGDRFRLVLNGFDVLLSSSVPLGAPNQPDPDAAFASGLFSRLSVTLDPGFNEFALFVEDSPYGAGQGFIRVVSAPTAVPVPGALALFGLGLLGLGGAGRPRLRT
ncbi:hypothetical protein ACI6QG_15695 [Roseococcus sp. DSY-14]|uniref:hypothetical protein n=1 Tax=Roseococcus sp. DSY-14 TaxID=3369650 RepID=UPI00387AC257